MVLTRLEVFLLGQMAAVMGSGAYRLGLTALLRVTGSKMLLLLLEMLLELLMSGMGTLLL